MRIDRLPLTYDESRARFRRAATEADLTVAPHPITALGPDGQRLTIDVVRLGAEHPRRALTVLSGVHGVEGFIGSTLQADLLHRLDPTALPDDVAVLVVHAVNPWGMAWWRRQNESNVDLNRNWRRDELDPLHNDPYDVVHPVLCPDTPELPSIDELFAAVRALSDEHGTEWVRDAITQGQYRHRDGWHFGGDRTEESSRILHDIAAEHLVGVERALTIDLHTGHGPSGAVTFLSDQPLGSAQDDFFRQHFGAERVEATADNPDATTGVKSGQIANGIRQLLGDATYHASSVEFGTESAGRQLVATFLDNWVHRHGDRLLPEHAAAVWGYRCTFTPDDPAWERTCLAAGRDLLDRAVAVVGAWDG